MLASAASSCTGSGFYNEQSDYVWDDDDDANADNYDCDFGTPDFYKVEHGSSIIYLGSGQQQNRWIHDFIVTGHAEHFTMSSCNGSWSHSAGIDHHRASFDANDSNSNFDYRADEWVKAHPNIDNEGSSPSQWMDWAFTGMKIAVGAANWKLGTAMALADVYLNLAGDNVSTSYDRTYDWDGYPFKPCSSHFIWQTVESDYGGDDSTDFDYIDEAWGRYPNYTKIEFRVQFDDATQNSTSSSLTTSTSTSSELDRRPAPNVGDEITNSEGETVRVEAVNRQVQAVSGSPSRMAQPEELSPSLQAALDGEGPVEYREFPARIVKTAVHGKILD